VIGIAGITGYLKDGDLVEVDANKGIIRKLNR
jgi:phosphohistidine swiveling domain-containing protein